MPKTKTEETAAKTEETVKAEQDPGMEMVEAFYQNIPDTKYSGDITVGLNGVIYRVQRGVETKIPRAVKEIIDNSYRMDQAVNERIKEAQKHQQPDMTM